MTSFPKVANRKKKTYPKRGKGLTKRQRSEVTAIVQKKPEKKYYDYPFDALAISTTPAFFDVFGPLQGTDSSSVIGESVNHTSFNYKFDFGIGDTANWIRFVMFQWKGDILTDSPNWNQIFAFFSGGTNLPVNQYERMSPYTVGEGRGGLFKIIKDESFVLDTDSPYQLFQGYINTGYDHRVTFNYADGGNPEGVNHLYVMFISDSGAIAHPTVSGFIRSAANYRSGANRVVNECVSFTICSIPKNMVRLL